MLNDLLTLKTSFGTAYSVDSQDVRDVKRVLNRLGYYTPDPKIGIVDMTDAGVFAAIKQFQKDKGFDATGVMRPDDDTVQALNRAIEDQPISAQYVWHTCQDDKVRSSHAAREGKTFSWINPPEGGNPGEDHNCRCWASSATANRKQTAAEKIFSPQPDLSEEVIEKPKAASSKWNDEDFVLYGYTGGGKSVKMEDTGWSDDIIAKVHEIVFPKLKVQLAEHALKIKNGSIRYTTKNYYDFGEILFSFGESTVLTETIGTVSTQGNQTQVNATISYQYVDEFTDQANIRRIALGTSSPKGINPALVKITDGGATIYTIQTQWKTKLSGVITPRQSN